MTQVRLIDGSIVQFETKQGGAFEAQAFDEKVEANLSELTNKGAKILLESIKTIRSTLVKVMPDELELEVGLSVGQEGSIIVAKGKAEANIAIRATWKASGKANQAGVGDG